MVDSIQTQIYGIIPARGGSKGIPGKNIKSFAGRPLISWTIEHLQLSGVVNVFVSTDSDEIAEVSVNSGAQVVLRPDELAQDTSTSESAIQHALRVVDAPPSALYVFAQATSPFRRPVDVAKGIEIVGSRQADSVFSAVQVNDLTAWTSLNSELVPMMGNIEANRSPRQVRPDVFVETGSFYVGRVGDFMLFTRRLSGKILPLLCPLWTLPEIDSEEDWAWMESQKLTELAEGW